MAVTARGGLETRPSQRFVLSSVRLARRRLSGHLDLARAICSRTASTLSSHDGWALGAILP